MNVAIKPKLLTDNARIGELGINIVQEAVLRMGFVWAPIGALDIGIDGIIELCNPDTGESLRRIIQVQSKATSRPFLSETAHSFRYRCDPRDLEYWLAGNVPVILVCSRIDTREAYWVSIADYFSDDARRKQRVVIFNKSTQRFDKSATIALLALVYPTVKPSAIAKSIRARVATDTSALANSELAVLPPNTHRAVAKLLGDLEALESDAALMPAVRDICARCRAQLARHLSAHAAIRARLAVEGSSLVDYSVFLRLLDFQRNIGVWSNYAGRALEQHASSSGIGDESLWQKRDKAVGPALLDQLVSQYASLVTGHDASFPFITVGDTVEQIDSHSFGIFRVPETYLDEIALHVGELWHEVGVQVFRVRYGIGGSLEADTRGSVRQSEEIADIADIYSDYLLFMHAFKSDLKMFVEWRIWSAMSHPNMHLASSNIKETVLGQLLMRCYRVAESYLRVAMVSSLAVDRIDLDPWQPARSIVLDTIKAIAALASDTMSDVHFSDETLARAVDGASRANHFLRQCMAQIESEPRPKTTANSLVEKYAELQMRAVRQGTNLS